MFTLAMLLTAGPLSGVVTAVAGLAIREAAPRLAWATGAAVLAAAALAQAAVALASGCTRLMPPRDGYHWVLWSALTAAVVFALPLSARWRWPLLIIVAIAAAFALVLPLAGCSDRDLWLVGMPVVAVAVALVHSALQSRWSERSATLANAGWAFAATAAIGMSGSASMALVALPLVAANLGLAIAWRSAAASAGIGAATALLITWQVAANLLYSELAWVPAILLLSAPAFGWLGEVPWLASRPGLRVVVRIGAMALPALAALAVVGMAQPVDSGGY